MTMMIVLKTSRHNQSVATCVHCPRPIVQIMKEKENINKSVRLESIFNYKFLTMHVQPSVFYASPETC